MNNIEFHIEDVIVPDLNPEFLRLWITFITEEHNFGVGDINYIFCSDDYILKINNEHLGHDYFTDIITFDYSDDEIINGDIYISVDTVRSNADEYVSGDFMLELKRVMIHGVLHLIGFDDQSEDDQEEMTDKENWALSEMESFT